MPVAGHSGKMHVLPAAAEQDDQNIELLAVLDAQV